jgi:Holliday junction resolvase RusA-like endonuclease
VTQTADLAPAIEITVYGLPAPQGSKRHVGKGIMVESSAKVKPWREAVKSAALWQAPPSVVPNAAPVSVSLVFTLPKPASAPKSRRTWPSKRPDIDKLIRSTLDALTDAGVFRDDAQVVELYAAKCFPGEGVFSLQIPGVRIVVSAVAA